MGQNQRGRDRLGPSSAGCTTNALRRDQDAWRPRAPGYVCRPVAARGKLGACRWCFRRHQSSSLSTSRRIIDFEPSVSYTHWIQCRRIRCHAATITARVRDAGEYTSVHCAQAPQRPPILRSADFVASKRFSVLTTSPASTPDLAERQAAQRGCCSDNSVTTMPMAHPLWCCIDVCVNDEPTQARR